jgi:hypothetical protein
MQTVQFSPTGPSNTDHTTRGMKPSADCRGTAVIMDLGCSASLISTTLASCWIPPPYPDPAGDIPISIISKFLAILLAATLLADLLDTHQNTAAATPNTTKIVTLVLTAVFTCSSTR